MVHVIAQGRLAEGQGKEEAEEEMRMRQQKREQTMKWRHLKRCTLTENSIVILKMLVYLLICLEESVNRLLLCIN